MCKEIQSSGVITTNISDNFPVFSREKIPTMTDNLISINYRVFSDETLSSGKEPTVDSPFD